ncbi:MAG: M48 family metalloprotease [Leptolyngbyaceae bacterium]|nr:M48 family metalloprotease [Leptolyngbyaceae bacterium]
MPSASGLLQAGLESLKQGRYLEAIAQLETFCQSCSDPQAQDYLQAQIGMAKAYQKTGRLDLALPLCHSLAASQNPQAQVWGQQALKFLATPPATPSLQTQESEPIVPPASQPSPSPMAEQPVAVPVSEPEAELEAEAEAEPVNQSPLSPKEAAELLDSGNKALKKERYAEAVQLLEDYCRRADSSTRDYSKAQMALVKAYKGNGQIEPAIALCRQLTLSEKPSVETWAKQFLGSLLPKDAPEPELSPSNPSPTAGAEQPSVLKTGTKPVGPPKVIPKAGRAAAIGVKLAMREVAANLSLASGVTLSLLVGMVLIASLSFLLSIDGINPIQGLLISIGVTLVFNTVVFFLSPLLMDFMQGWLYATRWVSLSEIKRYSPEAVRVIQQVCQDKKLKEPRLGIIEDQNPTAFTYGSLPNSARLVVSRGLFTYLDDDEIATVYAHELGHIVHWDFAVMTLASTLVQIIYLIYVSAKEIGEKAGNKKIKDSLETAALTTYIFYVVGEYLLLFLSRTREYYADHFAAETTGNPNALSRALVKIAYGIVEQGQRTQEPSKLMQGTRALGISDPTAATAAGTAYRVASEPQKIGRVFLWDFCNPWAWWMELTSTHPLTGKRVRALSTYAEQLGLDTEFDMSRVIRESRTLNKKRLYGSFVTDLIIYKIEWIGFWLGLLVGITLMMIGTVKILVPLSLALIGFGGGTLVKTILMYPDYQRVSTTDVLTLMSNPYASPLRGQPVQLSGTIIGRANPGYKFGADLKMQDETGMVYLHYCSRFGKLGNFLFGMTQAEGFIRQPVTTLGWFRRGMVPWIDLIRMDCETKWTVHSYHRFWSLCLSLGAIALGFILPSLLRF